MGILTAGLAYIIAGAFGGFIRAVITGKGLIPLPKVQEVHGSRHLNLGFLAPSTLGVDSVVATIAGYAGSDFIENAVERRLTRKDKGGEG